MFENKNNFLFMIAIIAVVCFSLGFTAAKTLNDINWVGNLVNGVQAQEVDKSIVGVPHGLIPKVEGDIIIGLRDDGVVVWKHASDSTK